MESIYLKTFHEAIACGNFSKAADKMFVTQSAVSRRIKFLEEQLDMQLIDRTGAVLVPTEAGKIVLSKAQDILNIEQDLLSDLSKLKKRRQAAFCCTPPFAITYLPKIIQQYMLTKADKIDLTFKMDVPEKILQGLKKGLYDFAVMEYCLCFDFEDFHKVDLPGDQMVFFANNDISKDWVKPTLPNLLEQTIFTRVEGCCSRTFLENNLKIHEKEITDFENVIVFDDMNLILQSVKNGDGIGYISSDIIRTCTNQKDIRSFEVEGFSTQRKRVLIFNEDPEKDSFYGEFKRLVLEAVN